MWFVDPGTPAIGTISQSGTVTEYTKGLQRRSRLISIVAAPDGTMWFSDAFGYIGRVDQTGTITEFSINAFSKTQSPLGIAVDAQGAVWTLARGPFESQLIRSDSQGHLTAVALPHGELADGTLAADAQGDLWMLVQHGQTAAILERAVAGNYVEYPTPLQAAFEVCCPNISPKRIAIAAGGYPWFTTTYWLDPNANSQVVGEISHAAATFYPLNAANVGYSALPSGITSDAGSIWFTGDDPFQINGVLWNVTPGGTQKAYALPFSLISLGSDSSGAIWLTAQGFGHPGQIIETRLR